MAYPSKQPETRLRSIETAGDAAAFFRNLSEDQKEQRYWKIAIRMLDIALQEPASQGRYDVASDGSHKGREFARPYDSPTQALIDRTYPAERHLTENPHAQRRCCFDNGSRASRQLFLRRARAFSTINCGAVN